MSEQKLLLRQRMVVMPLPPDFRVRSHSWQFPTLEVYTESLRLLGKVLPLPLLENLRLDQGAIRFTVDDKDYWYWAQDYETKEKPSPEITEKLFNLLAVLKERRYDLVDPALAQLKSAKRTRLLVTMLTAGLGIALAVTITLLEEFGCS